MNQREQPRAFPLRIFLFLQEIADPENEWEYYNGDPMKDDAKKATEWILARSMEEKNI